MIKPFPRGTLVYSVRLPIRVESMRRTPCCLRQHTLNLRSELTTSLLLHSPSNPHTYPRNLSTWRLHPGNHQDYYGPVVACSRSNVVFPDQPPGRLFRRHNVARSQVRAATSPQSPFSASLEVALRLRITHQVAQPLTSLTDQPSPQTRSYDSCHSRQHGLWSGWESSTGFWSPVWLSCFRFWIALHTSRA